MNCREFNNLICDYLENELSHKLGKDMQVHMDGCQRCRELYLRKSSLREELNSILGNPGVQFTSQSTYILRQIDKDRYRKSIGSTLKIHISKYWMKYISAVAIITALFITIPRIADYIRKQNQPSSLTDYGVQENQVGQNPLKLEGDKSVEIISGERELSDLMDNMKKQPTSAVPWKIVYADTERVTFYNYSHLLSYIRKDNINTLVDAVNIQKLNLGSIQGSSIIHIDSSPNGQFYLIGSWGMPSDPVDNSIYILDLVNGESKLIGKEKLTNVVYNWSANSRYFIIGDTKGMNITLFDLQNAKKYKITYFGGIIDRVFVSNEGKVNIIGISNKVYNVNKDKYDNPTEIKIIGTVIGCNGNGILSYQNGIVYEQNLTKKKELWDFGEEFKILYTESHGKHNYAVFNDSKQLKTIDIINNDIYDFKITPKEYEHYTFSRDYGYIATDDGRLININGKTLKMPPEITIGSNPALLENEIVYIESSGSNSLGDFEIIDFIVINTGDNFTIIRK